jgi:transposase InsO family protein
MPWKETDVRKERTKFLLEWERENAEAGRANVARLCRAFGVSRDAGHRWIRRYQEAGKDLAAIEERSHRPFVSPTTVSESMQDAIIRLRKKRPHWGPRKLRDVLLTRHAITPVPSPSTIGDLLKRHGLTRTRKRRRKSAIVPSQPFAGCDRPNAVWCVDFKGQFRTGNGVVCYPLTIMDAYSRFLLRCEILLVPETRAVQRVFDSAFLEFGLPDVIRSDNGPPFASRAPGGLSALSIWWIKLGIRPERIEPGKPQQNGRHERMHRTLKLEALSPISANPRAQQRAFDLFRQRYNDERPHEALGQDTPTSVYEPSPLRYPRPLLQPYCEPYCPVFSVESDGCIYWYRCRIFISNALVGELIHLVPCGATRWQVRYAHLLLGALDTERLDRGLQLPLRSRKRSSSAIATAVQSAAAGDKLRLPSSCLDNPAGCPHSPQPPPPPSIFADRKVSGISSD